MKKTANTLENRSKFFALYWRQKVGFSKYKIRLAINRTNISHIEYLELTPLSEISDEDLNNINFQFPMGRDGVDIYFTENNYTFHWRASKGTQVKEGHLILKDFDYLRSKGYALPYLDLSVEDLIEYGWIKIKR